MPAPEHSFFATKRTSPSGQQAVNNQLNDLCTR